MNKWKHFLPAIALVWITIFSLSASQAQNWRGSSFYLPQNVVVDESFDEAPQIAWHTSAHARPNISVDNGMYILQAAPGSELQHWFDLPLTEYDNYELDLSIALRNSGSTLNNSYGFIFGTTHSGERLAFTLGADGQYSLQELDSRGDAFVWQYDHAPGLVPYRFQQFIVRKVDDQVTFMVDGQNIYQWSLEGITGSRIGLLLNGGSTVMVDHIRVMKLGGPTFPPVTPTEIELNNPVVEWNNGYADMETRTSQQVLQGTVGPIHDWVALYINDSRVSVAEDGSFSTQLALQEGTNFVRLSVLLPEGRQIYRQLNIQFVPPVPEVTVEPWDKPLPFEFETEPEEVFTGTGRNFLVIIGVNQYTYWNDLHNAVKDCQDVAKVLVDNYQFEPTHVISLFNEQADRVGILETMERLQDEVREDDNLLIYYAGHGYYDEQDELGYWVPSDGRMDKVPDYIPNSTIHDYIATIDCQHTLLIADACFSGSLLSGSRGLYSVTEKSRWVFASGEKYERVFDGAPGTNSPFAEEMIEFLLQNRTRSFYASELIENVAHDVTARVRQHPIGSPLIDAGDNGGVFPFYPKR